MTYPDYNTAYAVHEFKTHGEYQLLEKIPELHTILDVGCNIGEWSRMARTHHPTANIHMFEIVPSTFKKLLQNHVIDENMTPNNLGLSHSIGTVPIKIRSDNDRVSTAVLNIHHDNSYIAEGFTVTADKYCDVHGINYVDYLKIDTEGHEYSVLEGCSRLLQEQKIACIQFEYGYISILTKKLLIDFHQLLIPHNFIMGKLTPQGVQFKDYHLFDEDFKGPDYVAVHKSRQDIIDKIKTGP